MGKKKTSGNPFSTKIIGLGLLSFLGVGLTALGDDTTSSDENRGKTTYSTAKTAFPHPTVQQPTVYNRNAEIKAIGLMAGPSSHASMHESKPHGSPHWSTTLTTSDGATRSSTTAVRSGQYVISTDFL